MLGPLRSLRRSRLRRQALLRPGAPALYPVPPKADVWAMDQGLKALDSFADTHAPTPLDDERPIFIAAVGWRVGSTLLQRVCCSDPSAIVWGEVLGNMGIINRISEAICIARPGGWPFPGMWMDPSDGRAGDGVKLADDFIANLYPPSNHLREGLQQLLFTWLGEPARKLGFQRWGLKEVRLSAVDALFLRWLFPNAIFLPLIRHPFKAYQSCRAMGGDTWVEPRTNSPHAFAEHWNRLALSWVEGESLISAPVIRYEELISGAFDFSRLAGRLDLKLRPEQVVSRKAGASPEKDKYVLDRSTRSIIRRIAGKGMDAYGYLSS